MNPNVSPINKDKMTDPVPTNNEIREPKTNLANISLPNSSVPKRNVFPVTKGSLLL